MTEIVRILIKLWKEHMEYSTLLFFLELIYQGPGNFFVHQDQMQCTAPLRSSTENSAPPPETCYLNNPSPKILLPNVIPSIMYVIPLLFRHLCDKVICRSVLVCCWNNASYIGTNLFVFFKFGAEICLSSEKRGSSQSALVT